MNKKDALGRKITDGDVLVSFRDSRGARLGTYRCQDGESPRSGKVTFLDDWRCWQPMTPKSLGEVKGEYLILGGIPAPPMQVCRSGKSLGDVTVRVGDVVLMQQHHVDDVGEDAGILGLMSSPGILDLVGVVESVYRADTPGDDESAQAPSVRGQQA